VDFKKKKGETSVPENQAKSASDNLKERIKKKSDRYCMNTDHE